MKRAQLTRWFLNLPDFPGKARLEYLIKKRVFSPCVTKMGGGFLMQLDPFEWVQRDLLRDHESEPLTTALFARLLQKGFVCVDVGCHVGYFTLVARRLVGHEGRVVAIDPQPGNAAQTLLNWTLNGYSNLSLHVAAIGAENNFATLPEQPLNDRSKLSLASSDMRDCGNRFTVAVRTLASILREESLSSVDLLKIDTEGYEWQVLKGLGHEISMVKNIILEILPPALSPNGYGLAVCEFLERCSYRLFSVDGKPWSGTSVLPENNLWARRD